MAEELSERDWQIKALEILKNDPRVAFITTSDSDRVRNRKFRNGKSGEPDSHGYCTDGRAVYIEFKKIKGKVTEEQNDFITRARAFNVRAGVARTPQDIEEILGQT